MRRFLLILVLYILAQVRFHRKYLRVLLYGLVRLIIKITQLVTPSPSPPPSNIYQIIHRYIIFILLMLEMKKEEEMHHDIFLWVDSCFFSSFLRKPVFFGFRDLIKSPVSFVSCVFIFSIMICSFSVSSGSASSSFPSSVWHFCNFS